MTFYRIAENETARLQELSSFELAEVESDAELDEIVGLVAQLCATPMAMISIIDDARQRFIARKGLAFADTPRDVAFCTETIAQGDLVVVVDARLDERFRDNPLVVGAPGLRAYAGFPLLTGDGLAVGTLAVMDVQPRQFAPEQLESLRVLARQVVRWLALRRNVIRLDAALQERGEINAELQAAQEALQQQLYAQENALERARAEGRRAQRLYQALWETTTDAVLIVGTDSIVSFASPSVQGMFGHAPEEMIGKSLAILQPERLRAAHEAGMRRYLATGVRRLDWRATDAIALRADGSEFAVEISFAELQMEPERLFVGFFRDITARKLAEQLVFEQKERADATLRSIGDGVIVLDVAGCVTFMNPLAEVLTGWMLADAVGRDQRDVLAFADGAIVGCDHSPARGHDSIAVRFGSGTVLLTSRAGAMLSVDGVCTGLRGPGGEHAGSVIAFRDVSATRRLTEQLTYQATHDHLTGLVNRGELERRLQSVLSAGGSEVHSLLYLDLDQFKVVNDTCGHTAGDALLRQLAGILRDHLRTTDTIARLGGDEFVVLLERCPVEKALHLADGLRQAIAEFPFSWQDQVFHVGVSIGHVYFSADSASIGQLLSRADEACYMAKDLGRNRVQTYQSDNVELAKRHGDMEWVAQIRRALNDERFVLYRQDIFPLADIGKASHCEILLRMRGEDGDIVPPMDFIPAAEQYNLMPAIDRWVIRAVCAYLGRRGAGDGNGPTCFAINLSGGSVSDAALPGYILAQLAGHGVPGSHICFEITETAAIRNLAQAIQLMTELKAAGCRFALDDFGSGMSSLGYLRRLPVDYLKIDGSFIRGIADDPIDRAMVAAIHQVGNLMGLKTIAEFVESERVIVELREIGVDFAQGFALALPRPL